MELIPTCQHKRRRYASVNSSSAHPPRANPRVLAFFKKNWANSPGRGRKKRVNAPPPGLSPSYTSAVFFINQGIKRSTFQYFNAMVLKTSRTTLRASLF